MDMSIGLNLDVKKLFKKEVYELAAQIVLKGHCKQYLAKDKHGVTVDPSHFTAVSFCTLAAIAKAKAHVEGGGLSLIGENRGDYTYRRYLENFLDIPEASLCIWNNEPSRTPEEIAAKLQECANTL